MLFFFKSFTIFFICRGSFYRFSVRSSSVFQGSPISPHAHIGRACGKNELVYYLPYIVLCFGSHPVAIGETNFLEGSKTMA